MQIFGIEAFQTPTPFKIHNKCCDSTAVENSEFMRQQQNNKTNQRANTKTSKQTMDMGLARARIFLQPIQKERFDAVILNDTSTIRLIRNGSADTLNK